MLVFGVLAVAAFGDTALNAWPMLFAHDAATGYLAEETLVTWWARTQQPSERAFTSLLDCGARALDLRVHVLAQSTQLVFQHGRVVIDHTVQAALQEVVAWA